MTPDEFDASIEGGSVYYYSVGTFRTPKPHHCVVLNLFAVPETQLILVSARTPDIWLGETASRFPRNTFVDASPKECPFLKYPSVFDCNHPFTQHRNVLVSKFRAGKLQPSGKVPTEVLEKLRLGVIASRLVENRVKRKLDPKIP